MGGALSLRLRLTLIILIPLLVIGVAFGLWQVDTARRTAADVFDRSLLSAALAVANDVTLSGGDALTPRTESILSDTSGGRVFYHVYAPDGVIVAGYATPPVGIPQTRAIEAGGPTYFDAVYLGRPVSGVRLQTRAELDGFSGIFTTTVWQDQSVRQTFVGDLVARALGTILALILTVALVVWFGVRLGLAPLLNLQEAIQLRSSDELSPIRRAVPEEVSGIVGTLNALFSQVSRSMTAQAEFASNAAHQLRNPIAGVLSLAEAVKNAPDADAARARADDLLVAAQETADLSQKLLTLDRAKALSPAGQRSSIDLIAELDLWHGLLAQAAGPEIAVDIHSHARALTLKADATMLREALVNLVDNARRHGGPGLTQIDITIDPLGVGGAKITVADNGQGIPEADIPIVLQRFSQLAPTSGSGLGLSIVAAVAEAHGGEMQLAANDAHGLDVTLALDPGAPHA